MEKEDTIHLDTPPELTISILDIDKLLTPVCSSMNDSSPINNVSVPPILQHIEPVMPILLPEHNIVEDKKLSSEDQMNPALEIEPEHIELEVAPPPLQVQDNPGKTCEEEEDSSKMDENKATEEKVHLDKDEVYETAAEAMEIDYAKASDISDTVEVEIALEEEALGVEETVISFWPYDLSESMEISKPVARSADTEFDVFGKYKKTTSFLKGCKWAPDGSCLISNSDDDVLRLFNVPENLYGIQDWKSYEESTTPQSDMTSVLKVKEGGQVFDYCFYPLMSSYDPVSSCFLTTSADSPVHLWDAFTGTLRASYLSYNHVDEVTAARSVAFDPSGENIYCGFDTTIRTFNITRPGRQCTVRKLKHAQITELNQPGIVSCISVNPTMRTLMAVGSYLKTVGLYYDDGSVLCILQGHLGGVTQLKFSHDGNKLFSGGRKDSRLICWDMRFMGEEYKIYDRVVNTNQRIYFDITPNDKYLVTGGTDGIVKVWDITKETSEPLTFRASSDCVNGVSINPFIPLLATSSGQRHVKNVVIDSDSEDDDNNSMISESTSKTIEERDVKLWKFC